MSLSVNWATKIITVPQSYLAPLGGSYYELDVDKFRLDLKDLEDNELGMVFPDTHRHNTEVTMGGITLARTVEIINGYTVTFQDGQYVVTLTGANNNILNVINFNQVSIQSSNTAGLIVKEIGSGVTQQDKVDIASLAWDEPLNNHTATGTVGNALRASRAMAIGRWRIDPDEKTMTIYDTDGITPIITLKLLDEEGNPTLDGIYERIPL